MIVGLNHRADDFFCLFLKSRELLQPLRRFTLFIR